MGDRTMLEKKVYMLGSWSTEHVDNHVIDNIKSEIQNDKGTRVKLQLTGDGLRVVKTSVIQGKMLVDFVKMASLQFFTVVKNSPDILFIVSLGNGDSKKRFHINVFRFANGMDASLFATTFKKVVSAKKAVMVVKKVANGGPTEEEINWTLRSKEQDNSKRQLNEKTFVTTKVTDGETRIVSNGHVGTDVFEDGTRVHMYRKGKPTRIERESFESDISDNRSEVSEGALRVELESLSQELRDIKVMLEKSTGITTGSEPNSPRDFEPVKVRVHSHIVEPETVVVKHTERNGGDNIDAVVITDDQEVQMRPKMNGYTTVQNGDVTHVRVSVPDYRMTTERSGTVQVNTSHPIAEKSHYEIVETRKTSRPSTTSYENWKRNTMERNAVRKFNDFPERIQWQSRQSNRSSHHVVSARPRSAIPSFSSDTVDSSQLVQVRHHPAGVGPSYQRVSFNPRVVRVQDRKTQSLRSTRSLSTTVARPIDRVYVGRADAKHHSLSHRSQSAGLRPSILVKENPEVVYVEQNNNVIKHDNDDTLLDVSGIDLYKETPTEGAVIRT